MLLPPPFLKYRISIMSEGLSIPPGGLPLPPMPDPNSVLFAMLLKMGEGSATNASEIKRLIQDVVDARGERLKIRQDLEDLTDRVARLEIRRVRHPSAKWVRLGKIVTWIVAGVGTVLAVLWEPASKLIDAWRNYNRGP